jgi:putative Mg2+ transporter-C (MgtC) family protein
MSWLTFSIQIIVAMLLGSVIGFERQWHQRRAGLRTNALVATGAAAFVALSTMVVGETSHSRIAAQVVSGVGFLGAGVILREGLNIRGINTAATLWCSAAVGTLAGSGFITPAAITTAVAVGANVLLRPLGRLIDRMPHDTSEVEFAYRIQAECFDADEYYVRTLLLQAVLHEALSIKALSSENLNGSKKVRVEALLITAGRNDKVVEQVTSHLSAEPKITAVSWESVEHGGANWTIDSAKTEVE